MSHVQSKDTKCGIKSSFRVKKYIACLIRVKQFYIALMINVKISIACMIDNWNLEKRNM